MRAQALSSARPPRIQQSSVIRHSRNHIYSKAQTPQSTALTSRTHTDGSPVSGAEAGGSSTASLSIMPASSQSVTLAPDNQLVITYTRQFLKGCGVSNCQTPLCASNPNFPLKDQREIAVKAVEAATQGTGEICPHLESRPTSGGVPREIVAGMLLLF